MFLVLEELILLLGDMPFTTKVTRCDNCKVGQPTVVLESPRRFSAPLVSLTLSQILGGGCNHRSQSALASLFCKELLKGGMVRMHYAFVLVEAENVSMSLPQNCTMAKSLASHIAQMERSHVWISNQDWRSGRGQCPLDHKMALLPVKTLVGVFTPLKHVVLNGVRGQFWKGIPKDREEVVP
ncbi:hypothetical protein Tco_0525965 [Tanacetum coccineum]